MAVFRTVDVFDMKRPAAPEKIATIDLSSFGSSVNSVAAHGGVVAMTVQGPVKTDPGTIAFYRATTLQHVSNVTVGALPDMVTFTPDGKTLLVANEGEPNDAYTVDPEGSVSIVDVHNINAPLVRTASFGGYNGQEAQRRATGIRIFGPNATAAQDFEPEYIATDADGRTAYVTLQENNALAIVDVASASVQQAWRSRTKITASYRSM
jgi:DNA-binding beta-propeller fold protein YncE